MFFHLTKFIVILIVSFLWGTYSHADDLKGPNYLIDGELNSECYYNQQKEFVFKGGIDSEALKCFKEKYKTGTETIRVNSIGGHGSYGLIIANLLKNENFNIVIEERCASACAIYILPIAKSITMFDGSGIVLHGAPSEDLYTPEFEKLAIQKLIESGLNRLEAQKELSLSKTHLGNQIKHGEIFKDNHNVRDGWYMEMGKWQTQSNDGVVKQSAVTWLNENNTNGLLVSRRFFESCLPDIEIKKFFDPNKSTFPGFHERIKNAGLIVLPHATCVIN